MNHGSKAILMGVGDAKREPNANRPDPCPPACALPNFSAGDVWSSEGDAYENDKDLGNRIAASGASTIGSSSSCTIGPASSARQTNSCGRHQRGRTTDPILMPKG